LWTSMLVLFCVWRAVWKRLRDRMMQTAFPLRRCVLKRPPAILRTLLQRASSPRWRLFSRIADFFLDRMGGL
jgi:hypothetical protein